MTDIAALIADMVKAGVDPDIIGRTAAALADREPMRVIDEQAERRRAADRERKRLRNSAESAEIQHEVSPKKETSPTPPKEKTTPSTTEPNGSSKTRASRLPADWVLPVEWREDGIRAGLPPDRLNSEAEKMRDWSLSSPSGAKLNWRAAWRNWAKSAAEKLPRGRGGTPQQPKPKGADHFDNFAEELRHGRAGNSRGNQGDWDDAAGVPILSIEHYRRNA